MTTPRAARGPRVRSPYALKVYAVEREVEISGGKPLRTFTIRADQARWIDELERRLQFYDAAEPVLREMVAIAFARPVVGIALRDRLKAALDILDT